MSYETRIFAIARQRRMTRLTGDTQSLNLETQHCLRTARIGRRIYPEDTHQIFGMEETTREIPN